MNSVCSFVRLFVCLILIIFGVSEYSQYSFTETGNEYERNDTFEMKIELRKIERTSFDEYELLIALSRVRLLDDL